MINFSSAELTNPIGLLVRSSLPILVELHLDGRPDRVADLSQWNTWEDLGVQASDWLNEEGSDISFLVLSRALGFAHF